MPRAKADFEAVYPCDFYTAAELFEPDQMYTVPEVARMLQGLDPDAEVAEETEAVLVDWAIPWIVSNADDMVVGEPRTDDGPGYYGLAPDAASTDDGGTINGDEAADGNEAADDEAADDDEGTNGDETVDDDEATGDGDQDR